MPHSFTIPFAFCDLLIIYVRFLRLFLRFCWATLVAMPVQEIGDKY